MPRTVVLLETIDARGGLVEGASIALYEDDACEGAWVRVVTPYPIGRRRKGAEVRLENGYYKLEPEQYRHENA